SPMKITLVIPAPFGSRKGNRVTVLRWARLLRQLGHRVSIRENSAAETCDLLIALHARRSFAVIEKFARNHPEESIVVALTGTDLYADLRSNAKARRSLELATRLVLLQPLGIQELPRRLRSKARVIYQFVEALRVP